MTGPAGRFVPFSSDDVGSLVERDRRLREVVGDGPVTAVEVGDGNLNQVFIVTARGSGRPGLVLKQALPYLRVAGEGWPLTQERMRFETQSLLLYNEIAPERAPRVHAHDADQSWVAMEYLDGHRIMRDAVVNGDDLSGIGRDVGDFVAALSFRTSEMSLDAPSKRALAVTYSNPALCHLQEEFVFTNPFFDSPENRSSPELGAAVRSVRSDTALKVAIACAKADYMNCGEALLHGDLHSGSVMVDRAAAGAPGTMIIDPEFAFFGPIAYDLGTFVANLAIGVLAHVELNDSAERRVSVQMQLIDTMREMWWGFVDGIESRWQLGASGDLATPSYWADDHAGFEIFRTAYMRRIAANMGRHGGCELLRRCIGIVSVAELEAITDPRRRAAVESRVIDVARRWLLDDVVVSDDLGQAIDHLIVPLVRSAGIDGEST